MLRKKLLFIIRSTFVITLGIFVVFFHTSLSYGAPKGQQATPAPHPAPAAPHPTPTVPHPTPAAPHPTPTVPHPAPMHAPAKSPRFQSQTPQGQGSIRAPVNLQTPQASVPSSRRKSNRFQSQTPQGQGNIQGQGKLQTQQRPSRQNVPSLSRPSSPSSGFGSSKKQVTTPGVTGPSTKGVLLSIKTQTGTTFKPWLPRASNRVGGGTASTSTISQGTRQSFFKTPGRRNFSGRNVRGREFFRNRFQRNPSVFFYFAPVLFIPYYTAYEEPYYPDYFEPFFIEPPYELEDYFAEEPDYIAFYTYINQILYPPYEYTNQEFYPEYTPETYSENTLPPIPDRTLEMQQIEELLQSVLQAMKIFDIPEFYNKPELSILKPTGSRSG